MYAKPFVCSNLANSSSGLARQVLEKAELGLPPDCLTYTKGWRGSPGRPRFGDRAMVSPRESLGSKLGARERPAGLMRGGGVVLGSATWLGSRHTHAPWPSLHVSLSSTFWLPTDFQAEMSISQIRATNKAMLFLKHSYESWLFFG